MEVQKTIAPNCCILKENRIAILAGGTGKVREFNKLLDRFSKIQALVLTNEEKCSIYKRNLPVQLSPLNDHLSEFHFFMEINLFP